MGQLIIQICKPKSESEKEKLCLDNKSTRQNINRIGIDIVYNYIDIAEEEVEEKEVACCGKF